MKRLFNGSIFMLSFFFTAYILSDTVSTVSDMRPYSAPQHADSLNDLGYGQFKEAERVLDEETLDELVTQLNEPAIAAELAEEAKNVARFTQEQAEAQEKLIEVAHKLLNLVPFVAAFILGRMVTVNQAEQQASTQVVNDLIRMHQEAILRSEAHELKVKIADLQDKKLNSQLKINELEGDLLNKGIRKLLKIEKQFEQSTENQLGSPEQRVFTKEEIEAGMKRYKEIHSRAGQIADDLLKEKAKMEEVIKELKEAGKELKKNTIFQMYIKPLTPSGTLPTQAAGQQPGETQAAESFLSVVRNALNKSSKNIYTISDTTIQKTGMPEKMTQQIQENFKKVSERLAQKQDPLKVHPSRPLRRVDGKISQVAANSCDVASKRLQPQLAQTAEAAKRSAKPGGLAVSPTTQQSARALMRTARSVARK